LDHVNADNKGGSSVNRPSGLSAASVGGHVQLPAKVAILLPTLDGGGAERMMLNLASGLRALGVLVELLVITPTGSLARELTAEQFLSLNCRRTRDGLLKLRRYLLASAPTVLLATLTHANILALIAARSLRANRRPKVVIREATSVHSASLRQASRWRSNLLRAALRVAYPMADAVVGGSEGAVAELQQVVPLAPTKIAVIPNPVWGERQAAGALAPLCHPWFLSSDQAPVIAVGRLTHAKDYPLLLSAIAIARRTRRGLRIVILGEGDEKPVLEELVRDLSLTDAVRFEGFVPNPYAYMSRASALVLSSSWEGSPNVIPEALGCGCPVVATDCPNGPREMLQGGLYGTLVPPGDAAALADGILTVLDKRPDKGLLRRRASDYSVAASAEAYLNLFNRLLAGAA
jgi:glycosyltransferase involved in cell wall biosynthesis